MAHSIAYTSFNVAQDVILIPMIAQTQKLIVYSVHVANLSPTAPNVIDILADSGGPTLLTLHVSPLSNEPRDFGADGVLSSLLGDKLVVQSRADGPVAIDVVYDVVTV